MVMDGYIRAHDRSAWHRRHVSVHGASVATVARGLSGQPTCCNMLTFEAIEAPRRIEAWLCDRQSLASTGHWAAHRPRSKRDNRVYTLYTTKGKESHPLFNANDAGYLPEETRQPAAHMRLGVLATTALLVGAELAHTAVSLESPPTGTAPLLADTARARGAADSSPDGAAGTLAAGEGGKGKVTHSTPVALRSGWP